MMIRKIVIFSPFAIIDEMFLPLVVLSKALAIFKVEVSFILCNKAMQGSCLGMLCLNKSNTNFTFEDKEKLCSKCIEKAKAFEKITKIKSLWLQQNKVKKYISKRDSQNIKRASLYELLLREKTTFVPKTLEFQKKINQKVIDNSNVLLQVKTFLKKTKPDAVVVFNSMYSIHKILFDFAKQNMIIPFSIQRSMAANNNYHVLTLGHHLNWLWKESKKIAYENVPSNFKATVNKHIKCLCKSMRPWDYSEPLSQNKIKFKKIKKIILVLLSSSDEVYAAKSSGFYDLRPKLKYKNIFCNQIYFLKKLIYLVNKFRDEKFLIRTHPRMFSNKREGMKSAEGHYLETVFRPNFLKRCKFNNVKWPLNSEKASLWDFLKKTKLVLNCWSSSAEVFSSSGIPVLSAFPEFENSLDRLHVFGNSRNNYLQLFGKVLKSPCRYKKSEKAKKWIFLSTQNSTVFLLSQKNLFEKLFARLSEKIYFCLKVWYLFYFNYKKIDNRQILKIINSKYT